MFDMHHFCNICLLQTASASGGPLRIQKFQDIKDNIPPYAILSHTWGSEEITFQDAADAVQASRKRGYAKLRNFCAVARKRGYEWAWMDTCCMDKRIEAEHSYALNSMFRWYQDSGVCYVYLEDVRSPGPISRSRWFTRGWTLQELIAPRNAVFFDANWVELGSKADLHQEISSRTGIPKGILFGTEELASFSVAQRMSWAVGRQTTLPEDRAYSLFGIFDISMSPVYGEGHRAFIRLQEEIIRVSDDSSLFAWRSNSKDICHRGLLADSPDAFAGCAEVIVMDEPSITTKKPWRMSKGGIYSGNSICIEGFPFPFWCSPAAH